MRAYISYSLPESQKYILTILSRKLKEQGLIISSSNKTFSSSIDFELFSQINKANVFIGIVTKAGKSNKQVIEEWKIARNKNVPNIVIIEDNVKVSESLKSNPNVLFFNKQNPELAIEKVKSRINSVKQRSVLVRPNDSNSIGWLLGGLAALVAIGLLSRDDD